MKSIEESGVVSSQYKDDVEKSDKKYHFSTRDYEIRLKEILKIHSRVIHMTARSPQFTLNVCWRKPGRIYVILCMDRQNNPPSGHRPSDPLIKNAFFALNH